MHPILFELPFGLPIYGYGAMLCLSVIAGRAIALHLAERDGLNAALMGRATIWALAGAIILARLLYVVTNVSDFDRVTDMFAIWKGGVVAYGGFLGGFAGAIAFCRLHKLPLLAVADCIVPALCIGLALTRIGCLLAGCDYGKPWDGPLAIHFPAGSLAFQQHAAQGLLPSGATESLPVHPTQLYESVAGLMLLGLAARERARRLFTGQVFLAFVVGYGALRALIEIVRADADRGSIGLLSTSQFIAVVTLIVAAATYVLRRKSAQSGGSVSCAVS